MERAVTAVLAPAAVAGVTTSSGTGPFLITGPSPVPGGGGANYRAWSTVAHGTLVHLWIADLGAANFERGVGQVSNVSGVVNLSWVARLETSAGGSAAVTWPGGGQRDIWIVGGAPVFGDFAAYASDFRSAIGLGSAALASTGTASGNLSPLDVTGRHPLASLPIHWHTGMVSAMTGGANNRICRLGASSGLVTEADQADANPSGAALPDKLAVLYARGSDGLLYMPGSEVPFVGVSFGAVYWLGSAGALTATPPVMSGSIACILCGRGIATGVLAFQHQIIAVPTDGIHTSQAIAEQLGWPKA